MRNAARTESRHSQYEPGNERSKRIVRGGVSGACLCGVTARAQGARAPAGHATWAAARLIAHAFEIFRSRHWVSAGASAPHIACVTHCEAYGLALHDRSSSSSICAGCAGVGTVPRAAPRGMRHHRRRHSDPAAVLRFKVCAQAAHRRRPDLCALI